LSEEKWEIRIICIGEIEKSIWVNISGSLNVLETRITLEYEINEYVDVANYTKSGGNEKELIISGWFLIGLCAICFAILLVIVGALYCCTKLYYKTKRAEKQSTYL